MSNNDFMTRLDRIQLEKWVEVTDGFKGALKSLEVGELLHDQSFSLFEAMSAIELMDPKMDAGMANRKNLPVTFDSAVKNGSLKLKDFSPSYLITVMDASVACLVTWLEGNSLAQTVFINLFLHQPALIEDVCLKAFCMCFLRIVSLCRDMVLKAAAFEEEDFQALPYGFYYAADISPVRIYGFVKEAEDDVQKRIRTLKNTAEPIVDEVAKELLSLEAVLSRLKFIRLFYTALLSMLPEDAKSGLVSSTVHSGFQTRLTNQADLLKVLAQCHSLVEKVTATLTLGDGNPDLEEGNYEWISGFEPFVNQRLLPPTFPKQTAIFSRVAGWQYLHQLLQRFQSLCKVTDCLSSYCSTLDFFTAFSSNGSCILSRSTLLVYYWQRVQSQNSLFMDSIKEAMRNFIQPPVLLPKSHLLDDPRHKEMFDQFMVDCTRVFAALIQISGHNRARQRDKLAAILEDFAQLQEEADKVDGLLHTVLQRSEPYRNHIACLGSFVLYHIVQVMCEYLMLGFELELYSPHEYLYIYWYLYHIIFKWKLNVLHKADNYMYEQDHYLAKQEKSKGEKKKSRTKRKLKLHRSEVIQSEAHQKLCEGYFKAMVGFHISEKIKVPQLVPGCQYPSLTYEYRMAPFAHIITPPPADYQVFVETCGLQEAMTLSAESVFANASRCFDQAKVILESQSDSVSPEFPDLLKAAKVNSIVLKVLGSGHKKESKELPTIDFSSHRCFPLLRV